MKRKVTVILAITLFHFVALIGIYLSSVAEGGVFELFGYGVPQWKTTAKEILEFPLARMIDPANGTSTDAYSDLFEISILVLNSLIWGAFITLIGGKLIALLRRGSAVRACSRPMGH